MIDDTKALHHELEQNPKMVEKNFKEVEDIVQQGYEQAKRISGLMK